MKDCILVTGGAGFIGCALSHRLAGHALPFVALDNLHPQIHPTRQRPGALATTAELVVGDVCRREDWDAFLQHHSPRLVIHLAAETGTGQSLTESVRHAEVNVVGTAHMLDAFGRHAIKPARIVLSSSRAIYGEGGWQRGDGEVIYPGQRDAAMLSRGQWDFPDATALPFDASRTRPDPTSIYGATKLAQEQMLASWCRSFGIELSILRLQNVYGPGQALDNPYTGIVPLFARLAKAGQSIPLYEDGAMLRDFVYIEDVADAIARATLLEAPLGQPLDIGTGQSLSIADLAGIVARHYGAPSPHVCGKFRNGDVRHASCHPDAAKRLLGWEPSVAPGVGVPRLCDWIDGMLHQSSRSPA